MIKIDKVRFHGSEKYYNRFLVHMGTISYVVRRPIKERTLTSIEKILQCKTEDELLKLGAALAPKGGKFSLEEYFISRGIN